jgi:ribosomal-protein-alanine N-acetyltransferase
VPELEQLRADHDQAILAFERENRAYFATSISDRGAGFFDHFSERYRGLLAEQEAGSSAFYVLVDEEGDVVGRFNLYDLEDGAATVGYRVAQHVAGHGVATGLDQIEEGARPEPAGDHHARVGEERDEDADHDAVDVEQRQG